MPTYAVELKPQAQRQFEKIRGQDYQQIAAAVTRLEVDPRPGGVEKLTGGYSPPLWRIRVGNYRVIFSINDEAQTVTIARVARRTERTYKGLE